MKYLELIELELAFHDQHSKMLKGYLSKLQTMSPEDPEAVQLFTFLLATYTKSIRNSDKTYMYYHNLKNTRT